MNRYNELMRSVEMLETDFGKFYEGHNKAAGTRVRKGLQEIKELAQTIRKEIQDMKNTD